MERPLLLDLPSPISTFYFPSNEVNFGRYSI